MDKSAADKLKKSIKKATSLKSQLNFIQDFTYDEFPKNHLSRDVYSFIINPSSQLTYQYIAATIGRIITENYQGKDKPHVLDWGCGKGQIAYFMQPFVDATFTLAETKSYEHTDLWDKVPNHSFISIAHPYKIDAPDSSFDYVLSVGVLEHVPHDQRSIEEITRILKPGGAFICFNLPHKWGYIHNVSNVLGDNYHDRLYSKKEVTSLLKRAGLKPVAFWRRQVLPKNKFKYKNPKSAAKVDAVLTEATPAFLLSSSLEFVAIKQRSHTQDH